jgi:hypothetical protein
MIQKGSQLGEPFLREEVMAYFTKAYEAAGFTGGIELVPFNGSNGSGPCKYS